MTTPISIGPVSRNHAVRITTRVDGVRNVTDLKEGETWNGYVPNSSELRISEIDVTEVIVGRTHIGRLASSS